MQTMIKEQLEELQQKVIQLKAEIEVPSMPDYRKIDKLSREIRSTSSAIGDCAFELKNK